MKNGTRLLLTLILLGCTSAGCDFIDSNRPPAAPEALERLSTPDRDRPAEPTLLSLTLPASTAERSTVTDTLGWGTRVR